MSSSPLTPPASRSLSPTPASRRTSMGAGQSSPSPLTLAVSPAGPAVHLMPPSVAFLLY